MKWRYRSQRPRFPEVVALATLLIAIAAGAQTTEHTGPPVAVGQTAPTFFNNQCDGGTFYLSHWCGPGNNVGNYKIVNGDLPKHVVVLSFFATWCGPCREELPEFEALRTAFGEVPVKWRVVAAGDTPGDALGMLEELGVEATCLNDRYLITTRKYAGEPPRLPTAIVVDQERVIRYVHTGYEAEKGLKELAGVVAELLEVPVPQRWRADVGARADTASASASGPAAVEPDSQ